MEDSVPATQKLTASMGRPFTWTVVINTATLGTVPADGTEVLRLRGRVGTHIYWVPIMHQGLH